MAVTAVFAQSENVLTDLPKNADDTKVRFVHKADAKGSASEIFERATCLFKETTLLMRNHGAHGAEFDAEKQIIRIKVKEKIEDTNGTKEVFFSWGFKAMDNAYAMKIEEIRFMPRSIPIEALDHEEEIKRAKARSAINASKKESIISTYLNTLQELIEARFENFDKQFDTSKLCNGAVEDEDDW